MPAAARTLQAATVRMGCALPQGGGLPISVLCRWVATCRCFRIAVSSSNRTSGPPAGNRNPRTGEAPMSFRFPRWSIEAAVAQLGIAAATCSLFMYWHLGSVHLPIVKLLFDFVDSL
jgi:hypothetical protein